MCFRRKKKVAEEPAVIDNVKEERINPMDIFLDISMVPVAPPKKTGVFRPDVLPEEFILYKEKPEKDNI